MRVLPNEALPRKNPNAFHPLYAAEFPDEAKWQRTVEGWFKSLGWKTYHTWNSMRSARGFLDLVLVHPVTGRTVYAELKTETGTVSDDQAAWLSALALRNEVYLWRPSDTDEIQDILQREHQASLLTT